MAGETDAELGLRERKKRETRAALSLAAIRLIAERGWANVTVDDIAATAGVSVRTFRNYFGNKAEAVAGRHLDRMVRIADDLRGRPASEPLWEAIGHTVVGQFDARPAGDHTPDRQWVDGIRLMLDEPALHGEIARTHAAAQTVLAEAIAERTGTHPTRDVYPALVASVVSAATGVATEHWLRSDPPVPFGPLLHEVFDRLAAGLPVP